MVQQLDAKAIKENVLKYLKEHGPSLPVPIAKRVSLSTIFTSAFLSELASEGLVKISDMKVGGSPLYYTPETYPQLENSIKYLNQKEREACNLLKQNSILQDNLQVPAIRVALRGLKDFAIPFKQGDLVFWRYFLFSEDEVRKKLEDKPQEPKKIEIKKQEIEPEIPLEKTEGKNPEFEKIEKMKLELEEERREFEEMKLKQKEKDKKEGKQIDIFGNPVEKKQKKSQLKKPELKKSVKKQKPIEDGFLNEIRAILEPKGIEITHIESFDKKEVFAVINVKSSNKAYLLAAYNKKKVDDKDLLKAYKKASAIGLEYHIISKGDTSKKTKEAIDAYKKLASIETINESKPLKIDTENPEQSNNKL